QSTYSLPSTSRIREPWPETMKIGSRPICGIARTGEFTHPGINVSARPYNSVERVVVRLKGSVWRSRVVVKLRRSGSDAAVRALPLAVLVGEVQQADLLEL